MTITILYPPIHVLSRIMAQNKNRRILILDLHIYWISPP